MFDTQAFSTDAFDTGSFNLEVPACAFELNSFNADAFSSNAFGLCGGGVVPPVVTAQPSAGFWDHGTERELRERLRRQFELEDDAAERQASVSQAAAHAKALADHEREQREAELTRLKAVAETHQREQGLSRRAQRSIAYALRAQTLAAYELMMREIEKAEEEEMMAVLMALALID